MRRRKKVVLEREFENTIILSGVQGCTSTDLDVFIFQTQYFKLSEFEKAYLQNST